MIVTVPKLGLGTLIDPVRPDTTAKNWRVIEETPTTFIIEILD